MYPMWQNQYAEPNRWLCMAWMIQRGFIYASINYNFLVEWYMCLWVARRQGNDSSSRKGEHVNYSSVIDIMRPVFCLVHRRTVKACAKWTTLYVWTLFIDLINLTLNTFISTWHVHTRFSRFFHNELTLVYAIQAAWTLSYRSQCKYTFYKISQHKDDKLQSDQRYVNVTVDVSAGCISSTTRIFPTVRK